MSVRLAQCGPVERRIKQRAMDARRRIANAVPKQLAAPAVVGSRAPSVQDIVARYRCIEWTSLRNYDSHVQAWVRRRIAVENEREQWPSLQQLRADFLTVCPFQWLDVVSQRRDFAVVVWRQAFMEAARRLTPCSLPQIGRFVGGKDHTTVLHASKKVEASHAAGETDVHETPRGFEFRVRRRWQ